MSEVAVVTDSTHYMPDDLVSKLGLHEVALYVNWAGRTDRETDMPGYDAYYDHLRTAQDLPTTSQPSVGDFLAVFEPLIEQGRDIISIHLSGGVSGTVRSAEQARDELVGRGVDPARIEVVDSATTCAGLAMLCMAASSRARAGGTVADCTEAARAVRREVKVLFAVDTLEFLRRGGRIGAAQAWIGTALKIKPILSLESEVLPIERVRTSSRAFERMVEHLQTRHDDGCDAWFVQHIQAADRAERLLARGREIFGNDPEFVSEIGPVVGTHAGPGLIGVAGVPRRLIDPGA
jgi:DegV family protein with EDD domain